MVTKIIPDVEKNIIDITSAGVAVGTLFQWLPAVAALFTIIWTGIRIYETVTVQRLLYGKIEDD